MVQNNISMKKLIASAGLVALGAASLKAQYAPGLTRMETSKPWSISASLRGFYDDNYLAVPKEFKDESFGFEVKPRVAVNIPREQTYFGAAYTYSMKWYEARNDHPIDHSHEVELKVDHRFSELYKLNFNDSFVYAQEPEVVEGTGAAATTFRTRADVLRNRASIEFKAQATETLGVALGYQNSWYDYLNDENTPGSRSALLDRMEHLFRIDGRWQVRPQLIGVVGYQFGINNYTGDELLVPGGTLRSDDRDNISHYLYAGADYTVSEQINASARVGIQYTDYTEVNHTDWSPYAEISGTYTYLPGSYVEVGFRHAHNATDFAGGGTRSTVTLDQESSTIYGSIHHRITPMLAANGVVQYQRSSFNGGTFDNDLENFLLAGVNLQYQITQNWSAEGGYNFDRLDSDEAFRSFTRNRVYIGVRAQY